jgi:chromosome segregation ATPase
MLQSQAGSVCVVRRDRGVCSAHFSFGVNREIPMSEQPRVLCNSCFCSLVISLLLCGCNSAEGPAGKASTDAQKNESGGGAEATSSVVAHGETDAASEARTTATDEAQVRQARIAQVLADLGEAQVQEAELMRKQGEVNARIEAHQEEGMAMLASLKSEMAKRQALEATAGEGGDAREGAERIDSLDERFSAEARSKLEPALAKDHALFAELEAVNAELESVNSRVETLHAELTALKDADLESAGGESNLP